MKKKYEDFLDKILDYTYQTGTFNSLNIIEQKKNVCIWGTGKMFQEAYEQHFVKQGIHVKFLCDNDSQKWHKKYQGVLCISPEELQKLEDPIVIPLIGNSRSVEKQLAAMGIPSISLTRIALDVGASLPRNKSWFLNNIAEIKQVFEYLEDERSREVFVNVLCNRIAPEYSEQDYQALYDDRQYFGLFGDYKVEENESFCDVGAYTGDTIEEFVDFTKGKFRQIYAFEMDKENYAVCCETVGKLEETIKRRIKCYNVGAWDQRGSVCIGKEQHADATSNSILKAQTFRLEDNEKNMAKTVRLDECLEGENITLLKMDIEGAEQNALRGAEAIITGQTPKLAICIYHKLDDMWKIPLYIKSLVPDYKLYIRLHSNNSFEETVCYAYLDDSEL